MQWRPPPTVAPDSPSSLPPRDGGGPPTSPPVGCRTRRSHARGAGRKTNRHPEHHCRILTRHCPTTEAGTPLGPLPSGRQAWPLPTRAGACKSGAEAGGSHDVGRLCCRACNSRPYGRRPVDAPRRGGRSPPRAASEDGTSPTKAKRIVRQPNGGIRKTFVCLSFVVRLLYERQTKSSFVSLTASPTETESSTVGARQPRDINPVTLAALRHLEAGFRATSERAPGRHAGVDRGTQS